MSVEKVASIPRLVQQWNAGGAPPTDGRGFARPNDPRDPHDFLLAALQSAITLEFATIPPYLCALWSIKDEIHPIAASLREIVQEEMLHMAIACNMLAAIGGQVKMTADGFVPTYPGKLPGGVHPRLEVTLAGLSNETLRKFLTIECPAQFPPSVQYSPRYDVRAPDRSIGQFYDCIAQAFVELPAEQRLLSVDRQLTGPRSWIVISTVSHVKRAVGIIKSQGEGADSGPYDSSTKDLAHYFRFQEILRRKQLEKKYDKFVYVGKLGQPVVWPMKATPKGGYRKDDVDDEVWNRLHEFDVTYSDMLRDLESAWNGGGQGKLLLAIQKMFELEQYAKPLMRTPIPHDKKSRTYGPCFRYIP